MLSYAFVFACAFLSIELEAPVPLDGPAIAAPVRIFRASDLLAPDVLTGPNYEIDEDVVLHGYWYDFRLNTPWGVLPARGFGMLELRIRELHAIERARKLSRDPQFVEGLLGNVKGAARGALIILTEPIGTLKRAPKGIEHAISPATNKVDRRAGSDTRRKLAAEIECDPETTNPVLEKLLDQMARRKGLGTMVGRAAMGLALPGLGLLPATAQFKDAVARKLPHEINQEIDRDLAAMGVADVVRRDFLYGEEYTTTRRLYYVAQLHALENVENRAVLVTAASQARSESDGMAILREMQMLVAAHREKPFRRIESIGLPVGIRADGTHVLICAVDHLSDTAEVSQVIAAYRAQFPAVPTVLHLSGHLEPAVRVRFGEARIGVVTGR